MTASLGIVVPVGSTLEPVGRAIARIGSTTWPVRVEVCLVGYGGFDVGSVDPVPSSEQVSVRAMRDLAHPGRGAAVRSGIASLSTSVVAIHQPSLEYHPRELAKLLLLVLDGRADAVIGSRHLGPGRCVMGYWRSRGHRVMTLVSNAFSGLNLTDVTNTNVVMLHDTWRRLVLLADDDTIDVEIITALARCKARVWEVPVETSGARRAPIPGVQRRLVLPRLARILYSRLRGNAICTSHAGAS